VNTTITGRETSHAWWNIVILHLRDTVQGVRVRLLLNAGEVAVRIRAGACFSFCVSERPAFLRLRLCARVACVETVVVKMLCTVCPLGHFWWRRSCLRTVKGLA
jgi:hypothetical protein